MPFSSQFSLSLELTKLLPLRQAVSAGGRALITLARELHKSGSDIVVEEDLAEIFGRNRLSRQFESNFRTAVQETEVHQLSEYLEVCLEAGAGPTVRRSLKDPRYFSMVAQLSLLAWSHDIESLALALHRACQQRLEDAPPEKQNFSTYDGILGTLQACRDQTSGFGWYRLFMAVERTLDDIGPDALPQSRELSYETLRGLLDFFLAVQMLPEDRYISINGQQGHVTVVVWAHHLLGLNVTVQMPNKFYRFGTGKEQVHFEWSLDGSPSSICLLDANSDAGGTEFFRISTDTFADQPLEGDMRLPAFGYGRWCLEAVVGNNPPMLLELAQKVTAYSFVIRQNVLEDNIPWDNDNSELSLSSPERTFEVGCFLFDGLALDWESFRQESRQLNSEPHVQQRRTHSQKLEEWLKERYGPTPTVNTIKVFDLSRWMDYLASMIFLFTHVLDLKNCKDLPLIWYSSSEAIPEHAVGGDCKLIIFENLAQMLLGDRIYDRNFKTASLVSSHGWSIYLPAIGLAEPSNVQPNCVRVVRGVPTRFLERKFWIVDVAQGSVNRLSDFRGHRIPASEQIVLLGPSLADCKIFAGPRGAAFEACLGINTSGGMGRHMLGFRYLQELRLKFRLLAACEHQGLGETSLPVKESKSTLIGAGRDKLEKLVIGRPDRNRRSRWLMMSLLDQIRKSNCSDRLEVDCFLGGAFCAECALQSAKDPQGPVYIVV